MKKNRNCFLGICSLLLILTGCWDVVNIEDRGFIIGNSIDLVDSANSDQPELLVTNQIVIGSGIPSAANEGGDKKAFINFKTTGKSIYKMEEEIATISNNTPFYEHLTTLIVSEKVAEKERLFTNLLDTYIRNVNLRRGIQVVIAKNEANKVLEYTTPDFPLPAMHIEEMLERGSRETGLLSPTTLGDIEEYQLNNNSYVLPYLELKDVLSYQAGAVFHGPKDKMVGLFNMDDMLALSLFRGEKTTKIIEAPFKDNTFTLQINRLNSTLNVDSSDISAIKINLTLEVEGIIKETFMTEDLSSQKVVESVQDEMSKEISKRIKETFTKAQKEFGTDVFRIWQELETKHYEKWQKIKDNWEEGEYYFKDAQLIVDVVTEIYSIGAINRTR